MCDVIAPDAPSQEVGHWSQIILHTAHVFVNNANYSNHLPLRDGLAE